MSLLQRARDAGLAVLLDGDDVVVRGPRRLGPLAMAILADKAAIVRLLKSESGMLIETARSASAVAAGTGGRPADRPRAVARPSGLVRGEAAAVARLLARAASAGLTISFLGRGRMIVAGPPDRQSIAETLVRRAEAIVFEVWRAQRLTGSAFNAPGEWPP